MEAEDVDERQPVKIEVEFGIQGSKSVVVMDETMYRIAQLANFMLGMLLGGALVYALLI